MKEQNRDHRAGRLLLTVHKRVAVAGAALTLTLFAMSVSGLSHRGFVVALIGAPVCIACVVFLLGISNQNMRTLTDERIAIAVAWLPNMVMDAASAAILVGRRRTTRQKNASG